MEGMYGGVHVWGYFALCQCCFSKMTSCIQQLGKRLLSQQGFKGHLLWIASASVEHGWWWFKVSGASSSPRHCQQAKLLRDDNPASSTASELSLPIWFKSVRALMNWFQGEHTNCNQGKGDSGGEVWFWKDSGGAKGLRKTCKPKLGQNAGSGQSANSLGAADEGESIVVLTENLAGERVQRDCCALLHPQRRALCQQARTCCSILSMEFQQLSAGASCFRAGIILEHPCTLSFF